MHNWGKGLAGALWLWCLPIVASGQLLSDDALAEAAAIRDMALESGLAYELLESLTTEVGPRMAGSEADARAVAWGKAKFEALGFDHVELQPVKFPRWVRGEESARVLSPYPHRLVVTALGGSVGTPAGGITANVKLFENLAALEAAPDDSLDGAIAFIANRMERARNGSGYGPAVIARRDGASVGARKGASAVLIRSIGTSNDRIAHTGLMRYNFAVPKIPAGALSNPDADLLERLLSRPEPVSLQLTLEVGRDREYTTYNVIGDIHGSEKPDEFVVIGCHLDSWDVGTGALDDGFGCATTMAAATLIARNTESRHRSIRVILYAIEEQGLIGARAYQAAQADQMNQHIIGAESDFGAGPIYQFSSKVKPSALGAIEQIAQVLEPLGITFGNNEAGGGPDLIPLRDAGMAVANLNQDGTKYFDYHHTVNDTLDKVDPESMPQNVAAYAVFAYLAAQYTGDFGFDLNEE
ncbi:MAG: M28 family peptidase [Pseudomonadota bacterium]